MITLSLKVKISICLVLIISIPLVISGYFSYSLSSDALQSAIQDELRKTTASASEAVESKLDTVRHDLEIAALNGDLARLAGNPGSQELRTAVYRYSADVQQQNKDLIELLIIADSQGQALVTSASDAPDLNVSDREYFKQALQGSPAVSDVLVSKDSGNPIVAIALPLQSGGSTAGVLIGTIPFTAISSPVDAVKIGNNGYAYMLNKSGLVLAHPVKDKIMNENFTDNGHKEMNDLVKQVVAGSSNEGFYTFEGIHKFVTFQKSGNWLVATTADYNEYMAPAFKIRTGTIWITAACIVAAIVVALILTLLGILRPIKRLQSAMVVAGEGDLRVRTDIRTGDEFQTLGGAFNQMVQKQEEMIGSIQAGSMALMNMSEALASSSEEFSASIEEINSSSQEIAAGAENSNQSVLEASQVLVQMSSLVQLAQSKASTANANAIAANEAAQDGRVKIADTVKAMEVIHANTGETETILEAVHAQSAHVSEIVGVLNGIARQTNLLALNAAIEASRAGEHGRGFAVVAGEVRKLSDESNLRATEISEMIGEMVNRISTAVTAMRGASQAVKEGRGVVHETDQAFMRIMEKVQNIEGNVDEIVDITRDEVATSDQIIKLIDSMGSVSEQAVYASESVASAIEQQASTVNQIAASAQEVSATSVELEHLAENFIIRGEQHE
ncbi:HAMP domain-containing protein [Paenibacillus sp. HN-1]|uniref:methyl-accepting chemotaxis protein n=1 Tax=Paenibacillus TaxID=44249 RepID=UPI001CA9FB78|nr:MULTISPECIES: methyl-accepting chemotaxis protein [Paenibacillus]MBY9079228.1 HAMP domain-containing protein [Paenibacillus sp. CGMCC 1.18879]MBY9086951.1 HAMP domain-containing protein [Paenibacillus sinensis]